MFAIERRVYAGPRKMGGIVRDKVIGVVEKYTDAVRRNDDKTNDVDVLHDSRERFKGSAEGFSTLIGIHGKYTDHIRMKRKFRWVVAPDCVDVFLDNAYDFVSHDFST